VASVNRFPEAKALVRRMNANPEAIAKMGGTNKETMTEPVPESWARQFKAKHGTVIGYGYVTTASSMHNRVASVIHKSSRCARVYYDDLSRVDIIETGSGDQYYWTSKKGHEPVPDWCPGCTASDTTATDELPRQGNCFDTGIDMMPSPYAMKISKAQTASVEVCSGCPVKKECRDYADINRIEFGTWGGEHQIDRRERWKSEG